MVEDFIKHKDPFKILKTHDNKHLLEFPRKMETTGVLKNKTPTSTNIPFFRNNLQCFTEKTH
jgi:hypothetical protein